MVKAAWIHRPAGRAGAVVSAVGIGPDGKGTGEDGALRANQPVSGRRWVTHAEGVSDRVPDHRVCTCPAVAGAGVAAVLDVQLVAADRNVVEEGADRPAMVRAGVGVGRFGGAVHEGVGSGDQRAEYKIVTAPACEVIDKQTQLAIVVIEGITPGASDDRNRIEATRPRDGQPLAVGPGKHSGVAKILRGDIAHPAVLKPAKLDEGPGVSLVGRRGVVGESIQIFDADLLDAARPGVAPDLAAAVAGLDALRNRRVHRDPLALNAGDHAVKEEITGSSGPGDDIGVAAGARPELIHAEIHDPVFWAGAFHDDGVTDRETRGGINLKRPRASRHESLDEVASRSTNNAAAAGAKDLEDSVLTRIGRAQAGARRGIGAGTF